MAQLLGAELHEMVYRGRRLQRYRVLMGRTVRLIWRRKPDVVVFQNPSLVLAILIVLLKTWMPWRRFKAVGDFHNAGISPPHFAFVVPWLVRRCDLVIVSNEELSKRVVAMGGKCICAPDPIPQITLSNEAQPVTGRSDGRFSVLCVCSWAADEPIIDILHAARIVEAMQPGIVLSITGRPQLDRCGWLEDVPRNAELTGYLSDADFEQRLFAASAVMDLTTRPDCMVCGAYEAVAAGVPMILSDNGPTMHYFRKGAVFTDNSADSIARALRDCSARHEQLRREVEELKSELQGNDRDIIAKVTATLTPCADL